MNRQRGFLAITTTAIIFGGFGVLIRELAKTFSDPGQVFARSLTATLIITLIVLYKKVNPFKLTKKDIKPLALFTIVFPLSLMAFTISANSIKVTNSLFMLYVGSLISTALLGRFVLKQKFTWKNIVSLILVVVGLGFFAYPFDVDVLSVGLFMGVAAGLLEGVAHTLRGKMQDIKREIVVFYQSLSGVVLASIILMTSAEPLIVAYHPGGIGVALLFGFLLVVIGYLLVYGFGNFDVNLGTIVLATELVFAMVINSIFLKEYPTSLELVGGLLIFSGTVVTSLEFSALTKKKSTN